MRSLAASQFFLFFLFYFFSQDAHAETPPTGLVCRDSLVSMTVDGIERVESTRLCVDILSRPSARPQIQAIASENCLKRKADGAACVAIRKAKEASFFPRVAIGSRIAPRTFDLCLRLGGEPASLKFQMIGLWHVTDRCLFIEDYSYIDTRSLADVENSPFR